MKFESYWLDTAPPFTGARSTPPEGHYDVAVIGGGLTGLSAARTLARGGARVALLEAGRVIGEASGRNGGQCNTGVAQDYAAMVERLGREQAMHHYRSYSEAVASVEQVIKEEGIECDYLRRGKLKLAAKPEHYEKLARTCEAIRRDVDPDVVLLSKEEARREVDSPIFHGGLWQKNGGQMHMGRFGAGLAGLADAAVRHGAHLHEFTPMTGVEREGERYRLTTPHGEFEADNVLLATGASQVGPLNWFRRRMAPVGSFIVVTEPLSKDQCARLIPHRRACVTSRIIGHYFRLTPDDRLLFGGRARFAMSGGRSDAKSGEILRRGLRETFPQLAETPLSALALAVLAERAGFPPGVINIVTGLPEGIGGELTANPVVRKLSFTGSTRVGRLLMRQCSDEIKRLSLELGGNAPLIVFDDADIELAVAGAMASKFRNAGQTCVCANRILVQSGIHDRFVARLEAAMGALKCGNGVDEGVTIGPLINDQAVEKVAAHIDDALSHGATLVCGGVPDGHDRRATPTLLTGVTEAMRITREETFGPVAPIMRFEREEEAVRMANDTPFGLAAYFFTESMRRAWRVGEALEFGMVGLNTGAISMEVAPFGGVKQSGLGREGARQGLDEYLEEKAFHMGGLV